jgi:pimeloyl-ACP methyl ester carboxylesterase
MSFASDAADTLHVRGGLATYAYRDFGQKTSPPVVLLQRFRGTLDHWDPAFLEPLAEARRVLVFDNVGVGQTPGVVPDSVRGMADAAVDFVGALGLAQVDLIGWSLGGFCAQVIGLDHPELVRRMVIAGSGPGGVPGSPEPDPKVAELLIADTTTEDDFLYLFFGLDAASQQLGRQSLARLETRLKLSEAEVSSEAWRNQLLAIVAWVSGRDSAWERLDELQCPVLIANGAHDVMVDASNSFAMTKRLKDATTIFYSDSGHGFLFQHPEEFGRAVVDFLSED